MLMGHKITAKSFHESLSSRISGPLLLKGGAHFKEVIGNVLDIQPTRVDAAAVESLPAVLKMSKKDRDRLFPHLKNLTTAQLKNLYKEILGRMLTVDVELTQAARGSSHSTELAKDLVGDLDRTQFGGWDQKKFMFRESARTVSPDSDYLANEEARYESEEEGDFPEIEEDIPEFPATALPAREPQKNQNQPGKDPFSERYTQNVLHLTNELRELVPMFRFARSKINNKKPLAKNLVDELVTRVRMDIESMQFFFAARAEGKRDFGGMANVEVLYPELLQSLLIKNGTKLDGDFLSPGVPNK